MPMVFVVLSVAAALACAIAPPGEHADPDDRSPERQRMVEEQLRARDIRSPRVLEVMARVPRHLFVPASQRAWAYADRPLPIGHDQTISQPYIVAFMTEALGLEPGHLEHRRKVVGAALAGVEEQVVEITVDQIDAAGLSHPPALVEQLKVGGLMAIPVGTLSQELRVVRRTMSGIETVKTLPVRFVPMTGKPKG